MTTKMKQYEAKLNAENDNSIPMLQEVTKELEVERWNLNKFWMGLSLGLLIAVIGFLFINSGISQSDNSNFQVPDKIYYPLNQADNIVIVLSNNPVNTQFAEEIQKAMANIKQSGVGQ